MNTPSTHQPQLEDKPMMEDAMNIDASTPLDTGSNETSQAVEGSVDRVNAATIQQQQHQQPQQQQYQELLDSLPENRFELELEFIQALSSPAYIHFLATSRTLDDATISNSSQSSTSTTTSQSTFQQLQPFLHYLYNTYSQPEYARFLRYPHALYFLESLLIFNENHPPRNRNEVGTTTSTATESTPLTISSNVDSSDATSTTSSSTNKLWVEWTVPSYRNFCHQQQFLAWQHRHSTCYGVGSYVPASPESADGQDNPHHAPDDTNQHQEVPATATLNEDDDKDDDMDDEDNKED